jgi:hypothetical protein
MALIPLRPAWRESDPRWRRCILLGLWILVLLPLVDVLKATGWASQILAPTIYHFPDSNRPLEQSLLVELRTDQPLLFCIGVVLLFAKERRPRPYRLDWTRRWGIICSYVVLLLSIARTLFSIPLALVGVGIFGLFVSMPRRFQPWFVDLLGKISIAGVNHGPPKPVVTAVLAAFSSVTVLLACVPLYTALHSSYPKRLEPRLIKSLPAMLVAPLALFALMHLAQAAVYSTGGSGVTFKTVESYVVYFHPQMIFQAIQSRAAGMNLSGWDLIASKIEATKWCTVLTITIWLTIAQVATWRHNQKPVMDPRV